MTLQLARRMSGVRPSAIRELLRLGADPSVTSFGGGYPDASLFPVEELASVYAHLLVREHAEALQYTTSNGLPVLRAQVAERLTRDGAACTADDVLIIQGGQQGLDLAAKLVVDPGSVIVTENPTFLGALIAFAPDRAHVRARAHRRRRDGHRRPAAGARAAPRRAAALHGPRLPEPDRRDPRPGAAAPPARAGRRARPAGPGGHALPRAALRGGVAADAAQPRHRGPRAAPGQLLQDPRAGPAARLGRRQPGRDRTSRSAQARRRHPEQHPQHGGHRGVPGGVTTSTPTSPARCRSTATSAT